MPTPTIDNLILNAGRCLVLTDGPNKNTGTLFRVSSQGFRQLVEGQALPIDDEPQAPAIPYLHVLFDDIYVKVKVSGVEYYAMHQDNILGVIPDD